MKMQKPNYWNTFRRAYHRGTTMYTVLEYPKNGATVACGVVSYGCNSKNNTCVRCVETPYMSRKELAAWFKQMRRR